MNKNTSIHRDIMSSELFTFAASFNTYHVQTNILQAPSARVPTVRKQGLLAVQLSGQRGGMRCALSSHTDLRLGRECQHGSRGDRLDGNDNGTRDDARRGQCDRIEGAPDQESGCENGDCTGSPRHCAGTSTKYQRLIEVRRGRRCPTTGTRRGPDRHLHPRGHTGSDYSVAQRYQYL